MTAREPNFLVVYVITTSLESEHRPVSEARTVYHEHLITSTIAIQDGSYLVSFL